MVMNTIKIQSFLAMLLNHRNKQIFLSLKYKNGKKLQNYEYFAAISVLKKPLLIAFFLLKTPQKTSKRLLNAIKKIH